MRVPIHKMRNQKKRNHRIRDREIEHKTRDYEINHEIRNFEIKDHRIRNFEIKDHKIRNYEEGSHDERKARTEGYFTVEAALIYPFVIAVILLIMYIWFYLYDSCLMEQDIAGVLLKGTMQQDTNNNERIEYMESSAANMYTEQYMFWQWEDFSAEIIEGKIKVTVSGSLTFPFEGLNFWNDENTWETERTYTSGIFKRMFIIRTFRKIDGILTNN